MQYVLTGFTQVGGFRVYAFNGIRADQTRTAFTVRADLSLIRTHSILVQELPLLCRALLEESMLEQTGELSAERSLTYSEDAMRRHADVRTADKEAAQRKKSLRKVPPRPRPADTIVMGMSREPIARTLVAG
jgi:hypothetical protein